MLVPKWGRYYMFLLMAILFLFFPYYLLQALHVSRNLLDSDVPISRRNGLLAILFCLILIMANNIHLILHMFFRKDYERKNEWHSLPFLSVFLLLICSAITPFTASFPYVCLLNIFLILSLAFTFSFSLILGSSVAFFFILFEKGMDHSYLFLICFYFLFIQIRFFIFEKSSQVLFSSFEKAKWAAAELSTLTQRITNFREVEMSNAREAERVRLSREIHDTVGYSLTAIQVQLNALHDLKGEELYHKVRVLENLTRMTLRETRLMVKGMRKSRAVPRVTDWLDEINTLMRTFSGCTGLRINFSSDEPISLPGKEGEMLYHCIQEGITNAYRHGSASYVSIHLKVKREKNLLLVKIADNGIGCENLVPGSGLTGMRERVESLGGCLIVNNREKMFSIYIDLPFEEEKAR